VLFVTRPGTEELEVPYFEVVDREVEELEVPFREVVVQERPRTSGLGEAEEVEKVEMAVEMVEGASLAGPSWESCCVLLDLHHAGLAL